MTDLDTQFWTLTGPRSFEWIHVALDPPTGSEVCVRVHYVGLCGSDMSTFEGRRERPYPVSLGHEWVGIVEACGPAASSFRPGDCVVSDLNFRCGTCEACQRGESHLCLTGQKGAFSNRGFGSRLILDQSYLTRVPAAEPKPEYALAEPLSCVMHAYAQGAARPGDRLLVLGAGSLGSCMALILEDEARTYDLFDPNAERLDRLVAISRGARAAIPGDHAYDLVFDLSGSVEGLRRACASVRRGGRLISMSHLDGYGDTGFLLPALTRTDVWFKVSYLNGGNAPLVRALDLIDRVWSPGWQSILELHPIVELPAQFERRRDGKANKIVFSVG